MFVILYVFICIQYVAGCMHSSVGLCGICGMTCASPFSNFCYMYGACFFYIVVEHYTCICEYFLCSYRPEHSTKIRQFMIKVMSLVVQEVNCVSQELMDIILINILDPSKVAVLCIDIY